VTQKAFERALGISVFLMEEIDKLSLKGTTTATTSALGGGQGGSTLDHQTMQISRQEIVNLLKGQ
jgi:hypothetical protein